MIDVDKASVTSDILPGKLLMQARLQAGLTLEQVAKELYMTVSKVKALESNDFGRLNSHTFARGYIRAYANLLKMDVVSLLAAYDKYIKETAPAESASHVPAAKESQPKSRGAWHFLVLIAVFFLGLWIISVWFFDNHSETEYRLPAVTTPALDSHLMVRGKQSASSQAEALDDTKNSQVVSQESSVLATVSKEAASVAAADENSKSLGAVSSTPPPVATTTSLAVSTQNSTASTNSKAQESSKKNSLDEISFSFRAESWLEVSDSRGDVLATELQAAGSSLKLVGRAPFDVKLGNAPGVDIQLNGKKIDVIPLLGSNVLTLKVSN